MDPLERGVTDCNRLRYWRWVARQGCQFVNPIVHESRDLRVLRWSHSVGEGTNVMLPPVARTLTIKGVRVWSNLPDWQHGQLVNVADLSEG